jgi:putative membrane protein
MGKLFWSIQRIWLYIWMIIIFWIFAIPFNIAEHRSKKETALDLLKKRFASGQIDIDEYQERKTILEAS